MNLLLKSSRTCSCSVLKRGSCGFVFDHRYSKLCFIDVRVVSFSIIDTLNYVLLVVTTSVLFIAIIENTAHFQPSAEYIKI
jgi:hypothetical protein